MSNDFRGYDLILNKSQIARDFWRKIFDENKIDLRNSDQRNAAVNEFLNNPQNIK